MCYLGLSPQPPPSSLRQLFYICTTPDSIAVSQFTKDGNAICISANIYLKPLPPQGLARWQKGQGSRSTPLGSSGPSGERTIWIRVWSKHKPETFKIECGCVLGSIVALKIEGRCIFGPMVPLQGENLWRNRSWTLLSCAPGQFMRWSLTRDLKTGYKGVLFAIQNIFVEQSEQEAYICSSRKHNTQQAWMYRRTNAW